MDRDAENQRRINNVNAWKNWSGYVTTSGCPCWDQTNHLCIPKSGFGYGFNLNFWYLFCCCLCNPTVPETPLTTDNSQL